MHSHIARILTILLLSLAASVTQGRAASVEEGVSAAFAKFKQALTRRDGAGAARYIDDRTADFYEKIGRAALRMPKDQLLKQPLFFQAAVLSTRLLFGKKEIENAEGRGVYAKLAAAASTGTPGDSLALVKVQPTKPGASAIAEVTLAGQPDSVGLRVFTQGGGWKIDLSRLLEAETKELQNKIGVTPGAPMDTVQSAIERDLFPIIAHRAGKSVSAKLWTPLANAN